MQAFCYTEPPYTQGVHMVKVPSPAVAIVGRHNSGKTTLIEQLIAELTRRGIDVGSVKHHSHVGFDIDIPGKDSYRHRAAGATETVIAAPGQVACVKTVKGELECADIVRNMPGHDIVIVEGYRKSGLPTIEIMRSGNEADRRTAAVFAEGARQGWPLGVDFTQAARSDAAQAAELAKAMHVEANGSVPNKTNSAASAPAASDDAATPVPKGTAASAAADNATASPSSPADAPLDPFALRHPNHRDISNKLPTEGTVAVVTDIDEAREAAGTYGIPAFDLDDVAALADFVEERFTRPRVTVVIQAGGESRRMGRSKATVPFAGRPLICRIIERLAPVADELVVTTNEPENLAFLHAAFPELRINLVSDATDVRGALPGLYTALQAACNPYVAVVACDMVFASPALVVAEALAMNEQGADVVVPVNKHGFEPFHAMYRRLTCLPAVRAAVKRGEKRAQVFFPDVSVLEFPQERVREAEPMGGCFVNANTPEELRILEKMVLDR